MLELEQPLPFLIEQDRALRDFQLQGRLHLLENPRSILSLDKGLGKTLTILSVFEGPEIGADNIPGFTVLIFTNERGIPAYQRDLALFPNYHQKIQIVNGTKGQRFNQWRNSEARYFITTYNTFLSDTGFRLNSRTTKEMSTLIIPKWVVNGELDGVVCDEFHRVFRRHTSSTFKAFKKTFPNVKYFFPMSGSVVSKGPQDLWAALHLCDPRLWSSYWKYVYTWCDVEDSNWGRMIVGPRKDRVEKWRAAIRPYIFHRTKEMVGDQLPPKLRFFHDVELPKWQKDLHDSLIANQFAEVDTGDPDAPDYIFASNTLANIHKMRMVLICPKALNPALGVGIGIESIADENLDGGVSRYAVFTPFKRPIPYLAEYLTSRGASVQVLQGGIGLEEQERRLQLWRDHDATPETPAVLISTVKYAESWEIPEASYGYFLGYEWDPEENKQAEGRLHRLISRDPVFIYYTRHNNSYDEDMITQMVEKSANVTMMFKNWVRQHYAEASTQ